MTSADRSNEREGRAKKRSGTIVVLCAMDVERVNRMDLRWRTRCRRGKPRPLSHQVNIECERRKEREDWLEVVEAKHLFLSKQSTSEEASLFVLRIASGVRYEQQEQSSASMTNTSTDLLERRSRLCWQMNKQKTIGDAGSRNAFGCRVTDSKVNTEYRRFRKRRDRSDCRKKGDEPETKDKEKIVSRRTFHRMDFERLLKQLRQWGSVSARLKRSGWRFPSWRWCVRPRRQSQMSREYPELLFASPLDRLAQRNVRCHRRPRRAHRWKRTERFGITEIRQYEFQISTFDTVEFLFSFRHFPKGKWLFDSIGETLELSKVFWIFVSSQFSLRFYCPISTGITTVARFIRIFNCPISIGLWTVWRRCQEKRLKRDFLRTEHMRR